jgi:hypothetical protein
MSETRAIISCCNKRKKRKKKKRRRAGQEERKGGKERRQGRKEGKGKKERENMKIVEEVVWVDFFSKSRGRPQTRTSPRFCVTYSRLPPSLFSPQNM